MLHDDAHRAKHLLGSLEVAQRLGIWEWTPATDEMVWSDGLYEILDVSPRIAPSMESLIATVHPADRSHFETQLSRARRERGLLAFRCRSGERTMHVSMQRTVGEDGQLRSIVGTNQDITGEACPIDTATLLATLTGTIAHEINNPLAVISAVLQMSPPNSATQDALLAVDRISSLLVDLNLYAWGDQGSRGLVHFEHLVPVALRQVPHVDASITTRLERTISVRASPNAILRLLVELVANAVESVETTPKKEVVISTRSDGREWSLIEIADSGTGIAPPVQARVFDPFFTTKGVARRGLGLAICRGIVDSLGGSITIHPNGGTRIVVALPTSQFQPLMKGAASEGFVKGDGTRGRVLIVDDEVLFANALSRLLSNEHDVTIVHDGQVALDQIDAGAHFDLILCDVMMPVMTGIELRDVLQQRHPEQADRMIFVTGGALDATAMEVLRTVECFEKPCDVAELREAVRRRVAASRRST